MKKFVIHVYIDLIYFKMINDTIIISMTQQKQSKLIRKTVGEVIEAMVKWADTDADDNNANLSLQVMLQLLITPEDRNLVRLFSFFDSSCICVLMSLFHL